MNYLKQAKTALKTSELREVLAIFQQTRDHDRELRLFACQCACMGLSRYNGVAKEAFLYAVDTAALCAEGMISHAEMVEVGNKASVVLWGLNDYMTVSPAEIDILSAAVWTCAASAPIAALGALGPVHENEGDHPGSMTLSVGSLFPQEPLLNQDRDAQVAEFERFLDAGKDYMEVV